MIFSCTTFLVCLLVCIGNCVGDYTINLKTLIIASDIGSETYAAKSFQSVGHPYDVFYFVENGSVTSKKLELLEGDGRPKYGSIILTSWGLEYLNKQKIPNEYTAAWSEDAQAMLFQYTKKFNVRMVSLNTRPGQIIPAKFLLNQKWGSESVTLSFNSIHPNLDTITSNMRTDGSFQFSKEAAGQGFAANFANWVSKTNPEDPTLQQIMVMMPLGSSPGIDPYPAVITRTNSVGGEEMHFFFTMADSFNTCKLLKNLWMPWVTKGIFLGQRRFVLQPQVDDIFMTHTLYPSSQNNKFRLTGNEFKAIIDWQTNLNKFLVPPGSNYTLDLAFNGAYWGKQRESVEGSLENAVTQYRDAFVWTSHTWNHRDFDCAWMQECGKYALSKWDGSFLCYDNDYTVLCLQPVAGSQAVRTWSGDQKDEPSLPESGFVPTNNLIYEISMNKFFAKNFLYPEINQANMLLNSSFSSIAVVTPRISGIKYSRALEALSKSGIKYVTGDNSIREYAPLNVYWTKTAVAEDTQQKYNVEIVGRHATWIFYDCSQPDELTAEYDNMYKYNYGTTSYEKILQWELDTSMGFLLDYRYDPYMFHQPNLRLYNGKSCLLCDWTENIVNRYSKWLTSPILGYKFDDLAQLFTFRQQRDTCNINAQVTYTDDHVPKSLGITAGGSCNPVVTLARTDLREKVSSQYHFSSGTDNVIDLFEYGKTDRQYTLPNGKVMTFGFGAKDDIKRSDVPLIPTTPNQVYSKIYTEINKASPDLTALAPIVTNRPPQKIVRVRVQAYKADSSPDLRTINTIGKNASMNVTQTSKAVVGSKNNNNNGTNAKSSTSGSAGLSTGAIVGIVIGAVVAVILLSILIFYCVKRGKTSDDDVSSISSGPTGNKVVGWSPRSETLSGEDAVRLSSRL